MHLTKRYETKKMRNKVPTSVVTKKAHWRNLLLLLPMKMEENGKTSAAIMTFATHHRTDYRRKMHPISPPNVMTNLSIRLSRTSYPKLKPFCLLKSSCRIVISVARSLPWVCNHCSMTPALLAPTTPSKESYVVCKRHESSRGDISI